MKASDVAETLEKNTLISVKEFEKDNVKFQKFKDQKKKENIGDNAFENNSPCKESKNETSCAFEQMMSYTMKVNPQNTSKTSLDYSQTSSKLFVQSIPKYSRDIQTMHAVDNSKGGESEQMSMSESYKSYLVCNNKESREEDVVNYEGDEIPASEKPKMTYSLKVNREGRVRRNRDMRYTCNASAGYMQRPISNLYSKKIDSKQ
jgi:hypothetical protein